MKKDFLIIKTGNTVSRLLKTGEDFEDWIIAGTGLEPQRFITASIFQGEPLPDQEGLKGIFITGSPAYLTDGAGWNQVAAKYLRDAAATEIPVLGICYGHQLLAFAFGGEVGFHPRGREMGTTMLTLLAPAATDILFQGLPPTFPVSVSHQQTVTRLPAQAVLLARNELEPHHAFRLGSKAWGVQFHPEFSAAITRAYLAERADTLREEGHNPEALAAAVRETPHSASLLRRFVQIARC